MGLLFEKLEHVNASVLRKRNRANFWPILVQLRFVLSDDKQAKSEMVIHLKLSRTFLRSYLVRFCSRYTQGYAANFQGSRDQFSGVSH